VPDAVKNRCFAADFATKASTRAARGRRFGGGSRCGTTGEREGCGQRRAKPNLAASPVAATAVSADRNAQGFSFLNKFVIFKYIPFSFPRRPAFFVKSVTGQRDVHRELDL